MSVERREPPDEVVKFAPKRGGGGDNSVPVGNSVPADDAGNGILALLHKAAESANEDCARAMDSHTSFLFSCAMLSKEGTSLRPRPITFVSVPLRRRTGWCAFTVKSSRRFFRGKGVNGHTRE
jgi:hypothetical protein